MGKMKEEYFKGLKNQTKYIIKIVLNDWSKIEVVTSNPKTTMCMLRIKPHEIVDFDMEEITDYHRAG